MRESQRGIWFQVPGFSTASCPARRGRCSRKGNIQSFASVLSFDVGRWTFDPPEADKCSLAFGELDVHLFREFPKRSQCCRWPTRKRRQSVGVARLVTVAWKGCGQEPRDHAVATHNRESMCRSMPRSAESSRVFAKRQMYYRYSMFSRQYSMRSGYAGSGGKYP